VGTVDVISEVALGDPSLLLLAVVIAVIAVAVLAVVVVDLSGADVAVDLDLLELFFVLLLMLLLFFLLLLLCIDVAVVAVVVVVVDVVVASALMMVIEAAIDTISDVFMPTMDFCSCFITVYLHIDNDDDIGAVECR
jgi:hypothetical protein